MKDDRTPLLAVADVWVSYDRIDAVRGVSFEVSAGEIVTLIGANGAGKSSILQAISGMLPVARGRVTLEGGDLQGVPAHLRVARGIAHSLGLSTADTELLYKAGLAHDAGYLLLDAEASSFCGSIPPCHPFIERTIMRRLPFFEPGHLLLVLKIEIILTSLACSHGISIILFCMTKAETTTVYENCGRFIQPFLASHALPHVGIRWRQRPMPGGGAV